MQVNRKDTGENTYIFLFLSQQTKRDIHIPRSDIYKIKIEYTWTFIITENEQVSQRQKENINTEVKKSERTTAGEKDEINEKGTKESLESLLGRE